MTSQMLSTIAGDIGTFRGGSGFPLRFQGAKSGQYPFFKVSDMNRPGNELFMTSAGNYVTEQQRKDIGAVRMPKDAIVFAKVGAAVFLERKRILRQDSCIDNNMCAFMVDHTKADIRYVHYLLANFPISSLVATTALPSLNGPQLRSIPLLLPEYLEEQRAIASALADADDLIATFERLIAKKEAIKQGMMQRVLTGKTRLPGCSEPWVSTTLGEIGEALIGLTYEPKSVSRAGTLVLRSSNVQDGRLAFDDNVYVDCSIPDRIRVRNHDILICVRNGSRHLIGKSAMLDRRVVGQTFGAFMTVFRSDANAYLRYFFQSDDFKRQVDEHLGATINQITNGSLKGFAVTLPSPREQAAIARTLDDVELELAALGTRLAKAKAVKQGMMQQLLTGRTRLIALEAAS